ncbi:MAG: type IV secretion protein IcmC [Legionella sp.]|nr:MAG: type IV secretion protein IcmC [Legionella sp.]
MNTPDIVTILGNISQSLYPVQRLITGGAYILGILFFITAIYKFRQIADHRVNSSSQEKMYGPILYTVMGAALLFLPTALGILSNTAFGTGNILSYAPVNRNNVASMIGLFIRTAGVLWFVRGCVLVAHSSHPGQQHGGKGLLFIAAGVLAMNFDNTIAIMNYTMNGLINMTLAVKKSQGF